MKALHVVVGGELAGGQIVCRQIIKTLRDKGHQSMVVSPNEGAFTERLKLEGVPVFYIALKKTYSFHRAIQLASLIRREKVDLVHTHAMVASNVQSRIAARLAGVPCVSHIHIANVFHKHPVVRAYQQCLDNGTSHFCEKMIAVSESTRQSLILQGIPSGRIVTIPNGVRVRETDLGVERAELLRRFKIHSEGPVVGMIGRLCPTKGQEEFLKAIQQITREIPDLTGVMIGKDIEFRGVYEARLKNLAQEYKLNGRMVFAGHQEDPFPWIQAMDFLVLPSKAEGMPLVLLEAMSMKKAVVASAVGGVPEVVEDGITGILVPPGDSDVLAKAILKLLKDPRLAASMGEAGFQRVQNFYTEEMSMQQVMNVYAELGCLSASAEVPLTHTYKRDEGG